MNHALQDVIEHRRTTNVFEPNHTISANRESEGDEYENKEYFCTYAGDHHDGASCRNSCNQL